MLAKLWPVKEHSLDEQDGIGLGRSRRLLDRSVLAMIEYLGAIATRTTRSERLEQLRDQPGVVEGVSVVTLGRRIAPGHADARGMVKAVRRGLDHAAAQPRDFGRQLAGERRLPSGIDTIDADPNGVGSTSIENELCKLGQERATLQWLALGTPSRPLAAFAELWDDRFMSLPRLPPNWFDRADESPDARFYAVPRLVTHIDDATIAALTQFYRETLSSESDLLDIMSSWVSHLPEEMKFGRVAGLGMNAQELAANPKLSDWLVHDVNREPELPYGDESFDAVLNAVSVQYLVRPDRVFSSLHRVLRPGGISIVAMSHRCFPTKAIRAFQQGSPSERLALVSQYHEAAGFEAISHFDRSPDRADPLWIVMARRAPE